jgi:hypothetical protein
MQDELSDLVPGDSAAIEGCLQWADALNSQVKDFARAALPTLRLKASGEAARAVLLTRASAEAENLAELLADRGYQQVVAPSVACYITPLLTDAEEACRDFSRRCSAGRFGEVALDRLLARIKASCAELKWLVQLMAATLVDRGPRSDCNDARPRWDRERRELWLGAETLRTYTRHAHAQFVLLDAFERAAWPSSIANPLGRHSVKDTVEALNDGLTATRLRFQRGAGDATIRWKLTTV